MVQWRVQSPKIDIFLTPKFVVIEDFGVEKQKETWFKEKKKKGLQNLGVEFRSLKSTCKS